MAEIRRLFYDTAQSADPENLGALLSLVPDTQVLFGTDYPYLQPPITIEPMARLGFDDARLNGDRARECVAAVSTANAPLPKLVSRRSTL